MSKQKIQLVGVNVSDDGGAMRLRAQGINDDDGVVRRVRRDHIFSTKDGGVGRRQ